MLENKEQEKIAGIISDFFDGAVNEADIDILAMKIYEKYVAKLEQDLEFTTKTANELIEIKHKLEQELAELKEKDNYHLRYELAGADETIANLRQQFAERQKTIDEINKEFVQAVHDWKALCAEKDKEISKLSASYQQVKTQRAIQELEKLQHDIWELDIGDYYLQNGGTIENIKVKRKDVCDLIDNQIKELKGEQYDKK